MPDTNGGTITDSVIISGNVRRHRLQDSLGQMYISSMEEGLQPINTPSREVLYRLTML